MAQGVGRNRWIALRTLVRADMLIVALLLVAAPVYAGDVNLAWDPVTHASLAGYVIHYGPAAGNYPNSIDVGNVTTKTVTNLTEGATYHFAVAAYDSSHVESGLSNDVAATIAYTVPVANFTASTVSGVAPLAMNFIDQSTGSITTYAWTFGDGTTSTTKNPSKVYTNAGTYSVGLTVTGPGGSNVKTKPNYITVAPQVDTTPPSAPGSLTSTANGSSGINLSWAAATDNVGVTGYRVERCQGASCTTFTQIATSTGTSFANTGLSASTTYRYRVRASDAAGNLGAYSPIASATTAAGADTTPPSAPGSLTSTATGSSGINLSWAAATDNVGVTGYRVERCQGASCTTFTQIATPTGTSFGDSGLSASTTYRYRVRASDAAGNLGAYSPIASATTAASVSAVPIAYVQNNYATPQSPQTSVSVTYTGPQTAGNLNVVVVGWNDTNAAVNSVTDSKGNVYTRAVGPTMYSTQLSQSIYYAKNVAGAAANSNVVTVQFSAPAVYADIRVVEYAGIDRINPVDVVAVGSGSGTMSATSSVNTTHAKDLIFAANTVRTITTGPGSGFTSRIITSPDGDIVQDRSVTSTGSYSASAPMTAGTWVMQLVAFRGM